MRDILACGQEARALRAAAASLGGAAHHAAVDALQQQARSPLELVTIRCRARAGRALRPLARVSLQPGGAALLTAPVYPQAAACAARWAAAVGDDGVAALPARADAASPLLAAARSLAALLADVLAREDALPDGAGAGEALQRCNGRAWVVATAADVVAAAHGPGGEAGLEGATPARGAQAALLRALAARLGARTAAAATDALRVLGGCAGGGPGGAALWRAGSVAGGAPGEAAACDANGGAAAGWPSSLASSAEDEAGGVLMGFQLDAGGSGAAGSDAGGAPCPPDSLTPDEADADRGAGAGRPGSPQPAGQPAAAAALAACARAGGELGALAAAQRTAAAAAAAAPLRLAAVGVARAEWLHEGALAAAGALAAPPREVAAAVRCLFVQRRMRPACRSSASGSAAAARARRRPRRPWRAICAGGAVVQQACSAAMTCRSGSSSEFTCPQHRPVGIWAGGSWACAPYSHLRRSRARRAARSPRGAPCDAAAGAQGGGWALRHRRGELLATLEPAARALAGAVAALRRWRARCAGLEAELAAAAAAAAPAAAPRLQARLPCCVAGAWVNPASRRPRALRLAVHTSAWQDQHERSAKEAGRQRLGALVGVSRGGRARLRRQPGTPSAACAAAHGHWRARAAPAGGARALAGTGGGASRRAGPPGGRGAAAGAGQARCWPSARRGVGSRATRPRSPAVLRMRSAAVPGARRAAARDMARRAARREGREPEGGAAALLARAAPLLRQLQDACAAFAAAAQEVAPRTRAGCVPPRGACRRGEEGWLSQRSLRWGRGFGTGHAVQRRAPAQGATAELGAGAQMGLQTLSGCATGCPGAAGACGARAGARCRRRSRAEARRGARRRRRGRGGAGGCGPKPGGGGGRMPARSGGRRGRRGGRWRGGAGRRAAAGGRPGGRRGRRRTGARPSARPL